MAFQKASAVFAPKGARRDRPDVEDAFEDSDDGEVLEDAAAEEEDEDLSKDKMIKERTVKAKGKETATTKKRAPKKGKK